MSDRHNDAAHALYHAARHMEVADPALVEEALDWIASNGDEHDAELCNRSKRMLRVLYPSETTKIGRP